MYNFTTLPSGLRVATCAMPNMESVAVGIWVGVGGRYETKENCGISHFLEHMVFKGTRRRSAREISEAIEGVGGYLNAFTGEENTCYYAKVTRQHLDRALDVLTDLYLHPRLDAGDVARERAVIKEELAMYRDQPQQLVHELLNQTLWPRHPLGYPVAGTPESLDRIRRADLAAFKQRHYVAGNTVVAVAGACHHDDVVRRVRRWLRHVRHTPPPTFEPVSRALRGPRLRWARRRVEQAALALGVRGYSRSDPRRYALKILSVLLGENMSSRLFQVIREERGLAYSIQSGTAFLADTGALMVSAGLDPGKLRQAVRLILRELRHIATHRPPEEELQRAKDYALGQMWLGLESTTNQMMWVGEHVLAYGRIEEPHAIEKRIQMLTPEEIKDVAADLFRNENLAASVVTPANDEAGIRSVLHW